MDSSITLELPPVWLTVRLASLTVLLLLPVRWIGGREAGGDWGKLALVQEPSPEIAWIGIRPEHLHIGASCGSALKACVVRVRELGAVRELQCRLTDGTPVYLQRPWNEPLPAPCDRLRIGLPAQHLRPLIEPKNGNSTADFAD